MYAIEDLVIALNILAVFTILFLYVEHKWPALKKSIVMSFCIISAFFIFFGIKNYSKNLDPIANKKNIFVSDIEKDILERFAKSTTSKFQINSRTDSLIKMLINNPDYTVKFALEKAEADDLIRMFSIITKLNYLDASYCESAFGEKYPINNQFFMALDSLSIDEYKFLIQTIAKSYINQIKKSEARSVFKDSWFIENSFKLAQWKLADQARNEFTKYINEIDELKGKDRCSLVRLISIASNGMSMHHKIDYYRSFFYHYSPKR